MSARTAVLALLVVFALLGSALAGCGEGPTPPPTGSELPAPVDADRGVAAADGGDPEGLDAGRSADATGGDASAPADPATDTPPELLPGYYVAEKSATCLIGELTLYPDGTFRADEGGPSPCDHPIPVGGRYAFEHLTRLGISYLTLHDPELAEQLPSLGRRRYAYRIVGELVWLRELTSTVEVAYRRVGDAPAR